MFNTTVTQRARLLRPLATVLLAATACLPLAAEETPPAADPNFATADQARSNLAEAVQLYRTGRYKEAALAFKNALALQPENKLIYEFYLACGDAQIVRMQSQDVLEDVLKDVLRRARIYQTKMRQDPKYIDLLISKLDKGEEERLVASAELASVGPRAVPQLLAAMSDSPQDDRRTYCRVVLTKMGRRATLPLGTALASTDQRQMRSCALVLGDLSDPRALPALLRAQGREGLEDTTKASLAMAVKAIAERAQITDLSDPAALHVAEALRYLRDSPEVRDEMVAANSLVWRWDESQQGTAKLQFVRVPTYAWNELLAEETVFGGLASYPETAAFHPLLAAISAGQSAEAIARSKLAAERTSPAISPEDATDAIAARVQALAEADLRVRMAGPVNACRAVQLALANERFDIAIHLMRILEDRDFARPQDILPAPGAGLSADRPGSVLVANLDHSDKAVRYQAAITLASLDPTTDAQVDMDKVRATVAQLADSVAKDTERKSEELVAEVQRLLGAKASSQAPQGFVGSDKVVPVLAQAVGEWGLRVVLVVDPDYRQRNAARAALQSKGFLVITAADGFEAFNRLGEAPVKDAVIVAGDLVPLLHDQHGGLIDAPQQTAIGLVDMLAKDIRLSGAPIFVALPDDPAKAATVQTAFDGKMPAKGGFVAKPFDAVEMNDKIDAALRDAKPASANQAAAEEIALRAAIALQRPDPLRTALDLAAAADALIATIDARADGLRIESLKALGRAALGPAGPALKRLSGRLTDVYGTQDAELEKNPQLRAAFVYALGKIDPTAELSVAIIKKALAHADAGVRAAAAGAVGASPSVPPALLAAYQQQQRLDARAAGAGKD